MSKINNSRLPENIKKAMIENPIPQISLSDSLDMNFVNGVKKLMAEEGVQSNKSLKQATKPQHKPTTILTESSNVDLITTLTPIIENIIRKTLDDIVDKKLTQILTAQQTMSINENLVLKVGDSIFKGKITGVNKNK